MKTTELTICLTTENFKEIIRRYHFREEDLPMIEALHQSMMPLLQTKAYYRWKEKEEPILYERYAVVFLTLGDGIDRLQEVYLNKKCLSEAYMVECISLELLTKAYEEFVKRVQRETGKWAEKIDFLGDTYPMEMLPELYAEFDSIDIAYNESLVLTPSKSVVFLLPMSEEKAENSCHICENCKNTECIFRKDNERSRLGAGRMPKRKNSILDNINNTYGYQRIFGSKR